VDENNGMTVETASTILASEMTKDSDVRPISTQSGEEMKGVVAVLSRTTGGPVGAPTNCGGSLSDAPQPD
jgi:predicted TIM-barrel enzyme